ncbi:unnamed protein product, partial [Meganyctiphanes norvegica]
HSVLNNPPEMKQLTGIIFFISLGMGHCSCPSSLFEEIGPGGCCYYFSAEHGHEAYFDEARGYCQELGALLGEDIDLTEIGTPANKCCNDVELLEAIKDKGKNIWIGARDSASEGTWRWLHSQEVFPLSSSLWGEVQPDSYDGDQDCLFAAIGANSRVYFGDYECYYSRPFICQIF